MSIITQNAKKITLALGLGLALSVSAAAGADASSSASSTTANTEAAQSTADEPKTTRKRKLIGKPSGYCNRPATRNKSKCRTRSGS